MKDNIKAVNPNTRHDGFNTQWQCRQEWEEQAMKSIPDDKTFLHWAEKAQQNLVGSELDVIPLPFHHSKRWIPYAAAASIVIGVTIIGLPPTGQTDDELPLAKEVTVESQTIHFMCNNGCSAQDIMLLANEVIK